MFRKLILVTAISVALLPNGAAALGLGAMRAQTALSQPFVGEIDLLDARPDELDTVKARLASPEAFAEVGAERFHYLTKLRFVPQLSDHGRPVVRVTSDEPVREPYMALLVEVIWPSGRLVREYTILLDLPSTTARPAPRVAPPPVSRPAMRSAPRSAPQRPTDQPRKTTPAPAGATGTTTVSADGYPLRYGPVPRGRGLWQVARRIAPAGATVPQTAMALYRNNQHAFAVGDINRLLVGQKLEIPSQAELLALDPAAAEIEFQAAISGRKVRRTPLTDAAAVAAQKGPTQLKIAGTGADRPVAESSVDAGGLGDIEQELLLVREAGESTRQETDHLHGRIRQLESQLADIQRLLTLRNQQLAQLQSSPDQGDGMQTMDGGDIPPAMAELNVDAAPIASMGQISGSEDAASGSDETIALADPDVAASLGEEIAIADDALQVVEASEQDALDASLPPADVEDTAVPDQAATLLDAAGAAPDAEPAEETASSEVIEPPSFLDSLPLPLPWLGAGAAALGLGGLLTSMTLRRRRRQAEEQKEREDSLSLEPSEPDQSGSTEAQPQPQQDLVSRRSDFVPESPYTDGVDALPASFDTAFPMEEDSDDADVLAEADIYIAYGRYREAETLLKDELTKFPGRADLQFKLADAYYGAGDSDALETLSAQMRHFGADRQDEEEWQRLVSMKQALAERGDDVDEPPSISSFGVRSPITADVRSSTATPVDRITEDQGAGGQADLDGRFPLDLGLDLSPVGEFSAPSKAQPASDIQGLAEIEEMDLDILSDQSGASEKAVAGGETFDLALPDSEALDLPSFGGDVQASVAAAATGEPESIKRPETADELASYLSDTAGESVSPLIRELNDDDLSSELLESQWQMDSGAWDEVGTKMELALAYMDMDDHDGARAILEEIKREGNDEQRAEAGELLAKLP